LQVILAANSLCQIISFRCTTQNEHLSQQDVVAAEYVLNQALRCCYNSKYDIAHVVGRT
jgi:hypothetical protein